MYICIYTHLYIHMWRDYIHICIYICDVTIFDITREYVWLDSLICVTHRTGRSILGHDSLMCVLSDSLICVTHCCTMLQCVAVCCSVLQTLTRWYLCDSLIYVGHDSLICVGHDLSVGSLKLLVSFAKEPYKRDDILQKGPIFQGAYKP